MLMYSVILIFACIVFFFFKQKTAYEMRISDWSSDVCSSDLPAALVEALFYKKSGTPDQVRGDGKLMSATGQLRLSGAPCSCEGRDAVRLSAGYRRSEERRVGKECVSYV